MQHQSGMVMGCSKSCCSRLPTTEPQDQSTYFYHLQPRNAAGDSPRNTGAQHAPSGSSGMGLCTPCALGSPTTPSEPPQYGMQPLEQSSPASPPTRDVTTSVAMPPAPHAQAAHGAPMPPLLLATETAHASQHPPLAGDIVEAAARNPALLDTTGYARTSNPAVRPSSHARVLQPPNSG